MGNPAIQADEILMAFFHPHVPSGPLLTLPTVLTLAQRPLMTYC